MRKVKISYDNLSSGAVAILCGKVINGLTGNTAFPAPTISIAAMTEMRNALINAINNAATYDRKKLAEMRAAKKVVIDTLRTNANYVNLKAVTESELISSGYELTKQREHYGTPPAVENLKALHTGVAGTIELNWKKCPVAHIYNIMISMDNGLNWSWLQTKVGRKLLCENLISKTEYFFKVIPVNSYGIGAPAVVSQIAA